MIEAVKYVPVRTCKSACLVASHKARANSSGFGRDLRASRNLDRISGGQPLLLISNPSYYLVSLNVAVAVRRCLVLGGYSYFNTSATSKSVLFVGNNSVNVVQSGNLCPGWGGCSIIRRVCYSASSRLALSSRHLLV